MVVFRRGVRGRGPASGWAGALGSDGFGWSGSRGTSAGVADFERRLGSLRRSAGGQDDGIAVRDAGSGWLRLALVVVVFGGFGGFGCGAAGGTSSGSGSGSGSDCGREV